MEETISRVTQIKMIYGRIQELESACADAERERRLWDLEELKQIKQVNENLLAAIQDYSR